MNWKTRVSLPYEFTLFSNAKINSPKYSKVSLPYEFTLFSNAGLAALVGGVFHYLMNLHYSQTGLLNPCVSKSFHYLMDLHYSQTKYCGIVN